MPLRPALPRLRRAVLLTACTAAASCASTRGSEDAPVRPALGREDALVGVSGSYTYNEDDREDREAFELRLEGGAHTGPEHEFGAWALGRYANLESEPDSRRDVWAGLHYRYHFPLADATSLFVGPTVGWSIVDTGRVKDDGFGYGAQVGIRHWLSEHAALTFTPTLFCVEGDSDAGGDSRDLVVHFGVGFRL